MPYIGSETITDSDGTFSANVTLPANTNCVVCVIMGYPGGYSQSVSSISLGGNSMNAQDYDYGGNYMGAFIYTQVNTGTGVKAFACTMERAFAAGGFAVFFYYSGINQTTPVRDSIACHTEGSGESTATDGRNFDSILTTVAGDFCCIAAAGDTAPDVDLQGQTKIYEDSSSFNSSYSAAAYKTASGVSTTMEAYGDYPACGCIALIPAEEEGTTRNLTASIGAISAARFSGYYHTDFSLTENPISEGGQWLGGLTDGLDWFDMRTDGTHVHGNDTTGSFTDPTAVLKGTWDDDQTVEAVVYSTGITDGYPEVELRLRHTLSAHSCSGYEVIFNTNPENPYVQIVRWNGPVTDFDYLPGDTSDLVETGDVVRASIQGYTISVWINDELITTSTDDDEELRIPSGNPGVGVNYGCNGDYDGFGFSEFTAYDNALGGGGSQYSVSCSASLGLSGSDSEIGNFPEAASASMALSATPSEIGIFPESISIGLSIAGSTVEVGNFPESISIGLSLQAADSEIAHFPETASSGISLQAADSEIGLFPESASVGISLSAGASEVADFVRTAQVSMGLAAAGPEKADFPESSSITILLQGTVTGQTGMVVASSSTVNIGAAASEIASFLRSLSASMTLSAAVSVIGNFLRGLSTGISVSATVTEKADFIEGVSIGLGLSTEASASLWTPGQYGVTAAVTILLSALAYGSSAITGILHFEAEDVSFHLISKEISFRFTADNCTYHFVAEA